MGGKKQQSPFMPGFKLHVVYQIFVHVSLSPNANVPFMKLDSGTVFLHIIWNNTTVPLFDGRKWTSGIFFPKLIRYLICDCKYSPIRALLSCSKMEMAPNPGTLKSTEICCVSKQVQCLLMELWLMDLFQNNWNRLMSHILPCNLSEDSTLKSFHIHVS